MTIHLCAWPTCAVKIPNSMLCCGQHWRNLPYAIRNDITRHYRMGQSVASWSPEYRAAIERFKQYAKGAQGIGAQPSRSQKMRDAGFTRRPSWRSLPKDWTAEDEAASGARSDEPKEGS